MKWEYIFLVQYSFVSMDERSAELNRFGEQGYEIIDIWRSGDRLEYLMKRLDPKQMSLESINQRMLAK